MVWFVMNTNKREKKDISSYLFGYRELRVLQLLLYSDKFISPFLCPFNHCSFCCFFYVFSSIFISKIILVNELFRFIHRTSKCVPLNINNESLIYHINTLYFFWFLVRSKPMMNFVGVCAELYLFLLVAYWIGFGL